MRKLAPVFLMSSMLAIAGTAFANNTDKSTMPDKTTNADRTDKVTGSPTVDANKQTGNTGANLSYSDKSNTSPGTNAKLDKNKKHKKNVAKSDLTTDTSVSSSTTMSSPSTTSSTTMSSPSSVTSSPVTTPAPKSATGGTAGAQSNSTTGISPQ